MADTLLAELIDRFRVRPAGGTLDVPGRSEAGVHRVTTRTGEPAVLKITIGQPGSEALEAAGRELDFYLGVAPRLGVPTPRLLDHWTGAEGCALLLTDDGRVRPPAEWTRSDWALLGRQLAVLHELAVPDPDRWLRESALDADLRAPDTARLEAFWHDLVPASDPSQRRRAWDAVWGRAADLGDRLHALPDSFVHGDCHTENVLFADGGLRLCDWQSAGIGSPAGDLSFVRARVAPSGITVPDVLLDAYAQARGVDVALLARAVDAGELAVLLLQYPSYVGYLSDAQVGNVRRRARQLLDAWRSDG